MILEVANVIFLCHSTKNLNVNQSHAEIQFSNGKRNRLWLYLIKLPQSMLSIYAKIFKRQNLAMLLAVSKNLSYVDIKVN